MIVFDKLGFICLFKLQFEFVGTGVGTLPCKSDGPKYIWDIRSFLFENNTFISCADKKRTKDAADGSAPRNPLRRSHFKDANGIEVSKTQRLCGIIRPQRLSASFGCCNFDWL